MMFLLSLGTATKNTKSPATKPQPTLRIKVPYRGILSKLNTEIEESWSQYGTYQ
jgi:hypothetical protein